MKPSEALRLARDILQYDGGFICRTLQDIDTPGARKAAAHVSDLLHPLKTYGAWLSLHKPEWHERYKSIPGAHTEARLCWIDDMIDYWESKGE